MHGSLLCMLWQHSVVLCSPHFSLANAQTLHAQTILQVQHWGYKAIAVSVASGQGMVQLAEALNGRISAVAGPSGVGKSSIINALRLRAQHAQHERQPQHAQHERQPQHAQQTERAQQQGQPDKAQHDVRVSMHHSSSNPNFGAIASQRAVQFAEPTEESNQQYSEASQEPTTEPAASNVVPHASDATASSQDTLTQTADVASTSRLHPSQEDEEQQQPGNGLIMPGQQQHSNEPSAGPGNHASSSRTLQNNEASSSSSAFGILSHSAGQHLEEEEEQVGMGAQGGVAEGVRLQSVGEMSNIGRGMHTTRHVALLEVHRSLHQADALLHHTAALLHQTSVLLHHVVALHFQFCTLFGCTSLFFLGPMSTLTHPCQSDALPCDTLDPPLTHPCQSDALFWDTLDFSSQFAHHLCSRTH